VTDRKVVLVIGPQFCGTKLAASICKTFFGCIGEVWDGHTPSPLDKSSNLVIRFSYPTMWRPHYSEVVEKKTKYANGIEFRNAGWVNIDKLISSVKKLYAPKNIHILIPIRDFSSVVKSGVRQGMKLEAIKALHLLSVEFMINLIKDCNTKNIQTHWLSYEFLTYDPATCISLLSNEINLPIILSEKDFNKKCSKIIPRNKFHVDSNNDLDYKPANHLL
jgi:hypothetical protein